MYKEGKAEIKFHKNSFINPVGQASRDISVALARAICKGCTVLDATTATGIRGIRYSKEGGLKGITMLEINRNAYRDAARNIKASRIKAKVLNESFQEFANTTRDRFGLVDIDPFGSAAPYLFDAMKIIKDTSLLFVTATDTAVLCGAHKDACLRVYDAVPMHNEFCHEAGMRILIGYIARTAAQFNYGIEVMLSVYYAHYMRTFIKLRHGAENAASSLREMGYAYYCVRCGYRAYSKGQIPTADACSNCGAKMAQAGKMWLGNLHEGEAIDKTIEQLEAINASNEAKNIMNRIKEELDIPFYYSVPELTKRLKTSSVKMSDLEGCIGKRYRVSKTHFDYMSIKTDAPYDTVLSCVKGKRRD